MARIITHEEVYHGSELYSKFDRKRILICGAGALGSNIAESLIRQGITTLRVVDGDRVEEKNLSTQVYHYHDIGGSKALSLQSHLYSAVQVEIEAVSKRIDLGNVKKYLKGVDLVIDAFDNSSSRQIIQDSVREMGVDCLHTGLHTNYGEVVWDERYKVPSPQSEGDDCDYPLARNIIMLTSIVACEVVTQYILEGKKLNKAITLRDLQIKDRFSC